MLFLGIFDSIGDFFTKLTITMCRGIYELFSAVYEIFLCIATNRIIDSSAFSGIISKIEVILGVVILFVLAYQALLLIIDPDKDKGGATTEKFLKNIIVTFILIVLMPSIFDFAYKVHDAILTKGVVSGIFTGADSSFTMETIKQAGNSMKGDVFSAFFYSSQGLDDSQVIAQSSNSFKFVIEGNSISCPKGTCTLKDAKTIAHYGEMKQFYSFVDNIQSTDDKQGVEFPWLICLIAGFYLIYVMINYCFDMAVRAAELVYFEIVAPIALVFRVIPGKEGIFKTWMKKSIKTLCSSIIHVFVLYLTVFIISQMSSGISIFGGKCGNFLCNVFSNCFIILGLLTFMKKIPKEIDSLFQLDSGISLGLNEKLKDTYRYGTAAGAGIAGTARYAINNARKIGEGWKKDSKDGLGFWGKFGHAAENTATGLGSTILGAGRSIYRGAKNGKNANNLSSMYQEINNSANQAEQVWQQHDDLKDSLNAPQELKNIPVIGDAFARSAAAGSTVLQGLKDTFVPGKIKREDVPINNIISSIDAFKSTSDAIVNELSKKEHISGLYDLIGNNGAFTTGLNGNSAALSAVQNLKDILSNDKYSNLGLTGTNGAQITSLKDLLNESERPNASSEVVETAKKAKSDLAKAWQGLVYSTSKKEMDGIVKAIQEDANLGSGVAKVVNRLEVEKEPLTQSLILNSKNNHEISNIVAEIQKANRTANPTINVTGKIEDLDMKSLSTLSDRLAMVKQQHEAEDRTRAMRSNQSNNNSGSSDGKK